MNPRDALVQGESLGGQFSYHTLNAQGTPMIHVTRSRRPEIVLFGNDQRFKGQMAVEAGNQIMVTCTAPGEISVAKFAVHEADQKRIVTDRVDEVIRAIVELGGTYPDVVQALQEAKAQGALPSRFEVDALPEAARTYDRVANDTDSSQPDQAISRPASPMPDLFSRDEGEQSHLDDEPAKDAPENDSAEKPGPVKAFFARMMGRSSS
jgi:hypothetical protein